ncbi:MAG: signal recognition particle protein [Bacteriovoracaceae bacterium]|nr:signal recognition particle protein [Bacteriovoracaceae bacterium]
MFDNLSEKFQDAFKNLSGKGSISESNIDDALKEIRTALLEADVNFKVVKEFIAMVKEEAIGEKVVRGVNPGEQFTKIVHDKLAEVMGEEHKELKLDRPINPILIVGLNGAGKTTFTGKLGHILKNKRKKEVYFIPADNFRPAAKDQLIKHAKGLQIDYFDSDLSMLPKDIVKAGMEEAKKLGKDVVIVDTAGRLQVDDELMGQLVDVKNELSNAEVLLVADAMTGQEAVNVAKVFHEKIGLTGVALSKMDSDARGGAALSIRHVTNVPIKYISTGEKMKDLEPFHPDRLAGRILDMGDVVTLVEKAQETIDEKEAERMMNRLEKQQFSINDFMSQMEQINKLGSMTSILKMLPGMGGMLRNLGDLSPAENEMKKMKVIISSMTQKEKDDHKLLKADSRIKRIAKGSGTTEAAVKDFIKKFEQMQGMMINMAGMMKGGGMPNIPGMGPMPGFRQAPGQNKGKKKGKKKNPFGSRFF